MARGPFHYFRIEARDLLEQLEQGALDLEKGVRSDDLVARLLRAAHTLKGAARVVKQPAIAEPAHELEDVLAALREASGRPGRAQIDRVLALLDQMRSRIAAVTSDRERDPVHPLPVAPPPPLQALRPELEDLDALVGGITEAQAHIGVLVSEWDRSDRIHHLVDLIETQLARVRGTAAGERHAIETVLSMVEELQGRFRRLDRAVTHAVDRIERELHEVADAAARLRLVPASAVFGFLGRASRDAAQALGKRVAFEASGGDVRVDSRMLAAVQEALLQVVRNAVAHGIEASDGERLSAGKPAEGHVTLVVTRRHSSVSFLCSDDGRGIDFAAVRRVLDQRGRSSADDQAADDTALLHLLLQGGLSTSRTVTDVAGRGIGLDVVRETAHRLGGDVTMHSEPGRGTTVELLVPSSMLSFEALLVQTDGTAAAVPLDAVRQTLRVAPENVVATAQGESILYEGSRLPLAALHRVIDPAARWSRPDRPFSVFVLETGGSTAAFAVDRILGTRSLVMRPLPDVAPALPSVMGAAIDAGGEPRLVLDPAGLISEGQRLTVVPRTSRAAQPSILVIDDSLTTRMLEQSILESAGYHVDLASSGEEALKKARTGTYALFLVDVEMPGMDGFTFIEQVRADPILRGIPSILVTSRASADDRRRGRDVGAQGSMDKGEFDQGALLERIRALVQ